MTTNLTNLTNAETIYDLALFVNQESGNLFFLLFTIVFFIVITMALKAKVETVDAIWTSSFITFIITLILSSLELVATIYIFHYLFIFIALGFYIYLVKQG